MSYHYIKSSSVWIFGLTTLMHFVIKKKKKNLSNGTSELYSAKKKKKRFGK